MGRNQDFLKPSSARPLPSGETACGVLWVGPGDLYSLEGLLQLWLFKTCRFCISVMVITVARDLHHLRFSFQNRGRIRTTYFPLFPLAHIRL